MDFGASNYVTCDLKNMFLHLEYDGSDDIVIDNGIGLHITHIGFTTFSSPSSRFSQSFTLSNVLCVPSMEKNLVFVSKFCQSNHILVKFLPFYFVVKDFWMRHHYWKWVIKMELMNGHHIWLHQHISLHLLVSKPLSSIDIIILVIFPSKFSNGLSPLISCFCHLLCMVKLLVILANVIRCINFNFFISTLTIHAPLELTYSDIWGSSPIESFDDFRYYVVFIHHFIKYL